MPDNPDHAVPEGTPPNAGTNGVPETKPKTQSDPVAGPDKESTGSMTDPTESLKRGLEKNRLPADVKKQIIAELPSLAEHERLYRELRDQGGLSSEEFFASLGIEVPPQS